MDEYTSNKILMKIGELDAKIESLQEEQKQIRDDIAELRKDLTGVKIKAAGFGTILGGLAGYLSKLLT